MAETDDSRLDVVPRPRHLGEETGSAPAVEPVERASGAAERPSPPLLSREPAASRDPVASSEPVAPPAPVTSPARVDPPAPMDGPAAAEAPLALAAADLPAGPLEAVPAAVPEPAVAPRRSRRARAREARPAKSWREQRWERRR